MNAHQRRRRYRMIRALAGFECETIINYRWRECVVTEQTDGLHHVVLRCTERDAFPFTYSRLLHKIEPRQARVFTIELKGTPTS